MDNNLIIPNGYADIVYDQQGGFVIKSDDQKQGFYFLDNSIINPKYSEVQMINGTDRYLMVKTFSGKVGYISSSGNEYFVE